MNRSVPVVDLFAGPGGLSEGFSALSDLQPEAPIRFDVRLSIENDPVAIETLKLRKFFRSFPHRRAPEIYYQYIRGEIGRDLLEQHAHWSEAASKVAQLTLGSQDNRLAVHTRIRQAIGERGDFVLIGGPPCQAYSLIGRARMTGIGAAASKQYKPDSRERHSLKKKRVEAFYDDSRHTLYRSYLEILSVHRPAIFVMENVKGLLSSKIRHANGQIEDTFQRVLSDLAGPSESFADDPSYRSIARQFGVHQPTYRLFPLSDSHDGSTRELFSQEGSWDPKDFIIRSERHGVPQKRHRVIVVGVRSDIDAIPAHLAPSTTVTTRDAIGNLPPLRSRLSPPQHDSASAWLDAIKAESSRIRRHVSDDALKGAMDTVKKRQRTTLTPGAPFIATEKLRNGNGSQIQKWFADSRIEGVVQHMARSHMLSDLGRYLFASTSVATAGAGSRSPTLENWPEELLPEHANVLNGKRNLAAIGFRDRFRVQIPDEPATTITAHIAKDGHYFIHYNPNQCRSLTVREAARLQTFPDNYFFEGNRTEQYRQVGNAVPPLLAYQIAERLASMLSLVRNKPKVSRSK